MTVSLLVGIQVSFGKQLLLSNTCPIVVILYIVFLFFFLFSPKIAVAYFFVLLLGVNISPRFLILIKYRSAFGRRKY